MENATLSLINLERLRKNIIRVETSAQVALLRLLMFRNKFSYIVDNDLYSFHFDLQQVPINIENLFG